MKRSTLIKQLGFTNKVTSEVVEALGKKTTKVAAFILNRIDNSKFYEIHASDRLFTINSQYMVTQNEIGQISKILGLYYFGVEGMMLERNLWDEWKQCSKDAEEEDEIEALPELEAADGFEVVTVAELKEGDEIKSHNQLCTIDKITSGGEIGEIISFGLKAGSMYHRTNWFPAETKFLRKIAAEAPEEVEGAAPAPVYGKPHTAIRIGNSGSREAAGETVEKMQRITAGNYHNFNYHVCPVGGSFDIIVTSDYEFEDHESGRALYEEDAQNAMRDFLLQMIVSHI